MIKTIKNMKEWEIISKQDTVLVIVKGHRCPVCKPISEKLENFMASYPTIPYYEIYGEDVLEFSGQYLIFTVPTIVIFYQGKEVLRESRFVNFDKIEKQLNNILN